MVLPADGQTVGPFTTEQLRGLFAAGQLQPRQAVWRGEPQRILFVLAAAACTKVSGERPA